MITFPIYKSKRHTIDFIARLGSFWIGCHYSEVMRTYCVAILPCCVIRIGKRNADQT
jgi:hypothetical protein